MPLSLDRIDQELGSASVPRESLSRLTHDISDQNYTILMAADLLLKYWDDLSRFLTEELQENQRTDEYREIVETMPVVISGVRRASLSIDNIIRELTLARKAPAEHRGEPATTFGPAGCDFSGGEA